MARYPSMLLLAALRVRLTYLHHTKGNMTRWKASEAENIQKNGSSTKEK